MARPPRRASLEGIRLVVFDKDGTLIDFDAMWGSWVVDLARRLEAASQAALAPALFRMMGYDPAGRRVLAGGQLAVAPMSTLRGLTVGVAREAGLPLRQAEGAVAAVWREPDPVQQAVPLADLPALFGALRARGAAVAVATTDDRAPTAATLAGLGVAARVEAMVCADDGIPVKPAPDMVLSLCRRLKVDPAQTAVVGDASVDLQMGRAAGAGLVIGVLSGVSGAGELETLADAILPSVAHLLERFPD